MTLLRQDACALLAEQRLLADVVELARRCDSRPPPRLLDAVLAGARTTWGHLPVQRDADER